jgi:hypothetical protein
MEAAVSPQMLSDEREAIRRYIAGIVRDRVEAEDLPKR